MKALEACWQVCRIVASLARLVLHPPRVDMVDRPGGRSLGSFRMTRWDMARLMWDVLGMVRREVWA